MRRVALPITTVFLAACIVSTAAYAATDTPRGALEDASAKIKKLVTKSYVKGSPAEKQMKEEVRKVVTDLLDYQELSKKSMSRYWAERTDAEKLEFTALLRELIEASYLNKITGNADYKVEFVPNEDPDEEDTLVSTKLSAKDGSVIVGFKMHQVGDKWTCWDLLIDDVSTMRNYRGEFGKIIKEQGYPALITKMKTKLDEIRKDASKGVPKKKRSDDE